MTNKLTEKDINKSSGMITAWQLSSTLSKMQEFIKYIQGKIEDKQKLQEIIPLIPKIKRIQEQRQKINTEIKQLMCQKIERNLSNKLGKQKQNNQWKELKKEDQAFSSKPNFYQQKLKEILKNIKSKNQQNHLKKQFITFKLKQIKQNTKIKQLQLKNQTKQQVQLIISKNAKNLQADVIEQQDLYQNTPKFSPYLKQDLNEALRSKQLLKFRQNKQNNNEFFYITNDVKKIYQQFAHINCKLWSLQDKKRKITVKNILQLLQIEKFTNQKLDKDTASQHLIIRSEQNESRLRKREKKGSNFLRIISRNELGQSKRENIMEGKQFGMDKDVRKGSKGRQEKENENEDQYRILKMVEIESQILQFEEHLYIGLNKNLLKRLSVYSEKVKEANEKTELILNEMVELMLILFGQSQMGVGVQTQNDGEGLESSQDILQDQRKKRNAIRKLMRSNQNVQFFMIQVKFELSSRNMFRKYILRDLRSSLIALDKFIKMKCLQLQSDINQIEKKINSQFTTQIQSNKMQQTQKEQLKNRHRPIENLNQLLKKTQMHVNFIRQDKINYLLEIIDRVIEQMSQLINLNRLKMKQSQQFNQNQSSRIQNCFDLQQVTEIRKLKQQQHLKLYKKQINEEQQDKINDIIQNYEIYQMQLVNSQLIQTFINFMINKKLTNAVSPNLNIHQLHNSHSILNISSELQTKINSIEIFKKSLSKKLLFIDMFLVNALDYFLQ